MLEVYDRVLPSRSVPTLVGLMLLAAGMYVAQGVIDLIRGRILVRVGQRLDEALSARVYDTIVRLPLKVGSRRRGHSADPRSRHGARLSVRHRPGGVLRSAVDAVLSRDLLCLPLLYRPDRAVRRHHPRSRSTVMTELQTRHPTRSATQFAARAQRPAGSEPAQCRGDHRHGHGRPDFQALGRSQSQLYRRQRPRQRRRRRARRDVEGLADAAAIGDARGRRVRW